MSRGFYGNVSEFYDEMINFDLLLANRHGIKNFILPEYKSATDIGCGTGIDSIAMSKLGLFVTALDPSPEMILKAKTNAQKYAVKINFQNTGISEIIKVSDNQDLVISLGNTSANISPEELENGLKAIYNILNPGGRFILQQINYSNPGYVSPSIISIKETETGTIIRFNTGDDESLNFHIMKYDRSDNSKNTLLSTRIFSHKKEWFEKVLAAAGFKQIGFFGDLEKNRFDKEKSRNLVISAQK